MAKGGIDSDSSVETVEVLISQWLECAMDELNETEFLKIAEQVKDLIIAEHQNPHLKDTDYSLSVSFREFTTTLKEFSTSLYRSLNARVEVKAREMQTNLERIYNIKSQISNIKDEVESASEECIKGGDFQKILPELYDLTLESFNMVRTKIRIINIDVGKQIQDIKKGCKFFKQFPPIISIYSQGQDISEYIEETDVVEGGDIDVSDGVHPPIVLLENPGENNEVVANHESLECEQFPQFLSKLGDQKFLEFVEANSKLEENDTAQIFYNEFFKRLREIGQDISTIIGIQTVIEGYKEAMEAKIADMTNLSQGLYDSLSLKMLELKLEFGMQIKEIEGKLRECSQLSQLKVRYDILTDGFPEELSEYFRNIHQDTTFMDDFIMVGTDEEARDTEVSGASASTVVGE